MPSRSERSWFAKNARASLLVGLALALELALPRSALATTIVVPVSPYPLVNTTVYYAVGISVDTLDPNGAFLSLDAGAGQISGNPDPSLQSLIQLDLTSDVPGTNSAAGWVTPYVSTSNSDRPVPIAYAQETSCTTGICQGNTISGSSAFHSAALTSGQALRLGFYINDICRDTIAQSGGGTVNTTYCNASGLQSLGSTNFPVTLKFYVGTPDANGLVPATGAAAATITLSFHSTPPQLTSCPATDTSTGERPFYFPGDGEVFIDTNLYSGGSGAGIPLEKVLAFASPGGTATTTPFGSGVELIGRLPYNSGSQSVSGFTNTTGTDDHPYAMAFSVRDMSGAYSSVNTACSQTAIRTAEIQGFLKKGNCFIATATYRDPDGPSVERLRQFRDHVLLKFGAGRRFVSWYYHWSPEAAEWLMRNSVFRTPVMIALVPVQAIAWLALRPPLMAALASLGLMLLAVFSIRLRRERAK
jgi:hypothetical protein